MEQGCLKRVDINTCYHLLKQKRWRKTFWSYSLLIFSEKRPICSPIKRETCKMQIFGRLTDSNSMCKLLCKKHRSVTMFKISSNICEIVPLCQAGGEIRVLKIGKTRIDQAETASSTFSTKSSSLGKSYSSHYKNINQSLTLSKKWQSEYKLSGNQPGWNVDQRDEYCDLQPESLEVMLAVPMLSLPCKSNITTSAAAKSHVCTESWLFWLSWWS